MTTLYLFAFLSFLLSLIFSLLGFHNKKNSLGSIIFLSAACAILTLEIIFRFLLTGQLPVVSLPTTFPFMALLISLSTIIFLILKRRSNYSNSKTLIIASTAGLLCILLSTFFGPVSRAPLPPILNAPFWLVFHVLTIICGYAAGLTASIWGKISALSQIRKKLINATVNHNDERTRLFLLLALILTASGTLLGGFWADQSWGSFWSWDPKENGALLIIIWSALAIHGRLTHLWSNFGTAVSASFLTAVISFSWLGTNLLGKGHHSYGFTNQGLSVLILILIFEVGFQIFCAVKYKLIHSDKK